MSKRTKSIGSLGLVVALAAMFGKDARSTPMVAGVERDLRDSLVVNGGFEGTWTPTPDGNSQPDGWTEGRSVGCAYLPTIGPVMDNGPSFAGSISAGWVRPSGSNDGCGITLTQPIDVPSSLLPTLSLDVKVNSHNLVGGGSWTPASEWPVYVQLVYERASDPALHQTWIHGFFINPPGDGSTIIDPGEGIIAEYEDTEVPAGVWTTHAFDLTAELPDFGRLIQVGVFGRGWAYDGQADNVSIQQEVAACCQQDGNCTLEIDESACTTAGGTWQGDGSTCDPNPCFLPGAPLPAPFPHDRLKNRCISFDPNKAVNGTTNVAFKIELIDIKQGSCNNVESSPCRYLQGTGLNEPGNADCRRCASGSNAGQPCISSSVDCVGDPCNADPASFPCSNDAPASAADTNLGLVRWAGQPDATPQLPFAPTGTHISRADPMAFAQVGTAWPDEVHVCDCEIVPQATYKVTTVAMPSLQESTALNVSTIARPAAGVYAWWADAVSLKAKYCNNGLPSGTTCVNDAGCGGTPGSCVLGWGPPNGFTNADDILATLSVYKAFGPKPVPPTGPGSMATPQVADITWIDMHDVVPNAVSNASDVQNIGLAFAGRPYPFPDPLDCP